jgi:glutamate/tyrosine decarboxylase-like PLP-dependent enzyme
MVDGIMTPGGSFANFMGLLLARFKAHPEANSKGLYGLKPMKILTSEVSHYSIKKGMILIGMGTENLIYVKTDKNRKIIPE